MAAHGALLWCFLDIFLFSDAILVVVRKVCLEDGAMLVLRLQDPHHVSGSLRSFWIEEMLLSVITSGEYIRIIFDRRFTPPWLLQLDAEPVVQKSKNIIILGDAGADLIKQMKQITQNKLWNSRGNILIAVRDVQAVDNVLKMGIKKSTKCRDDGRC